MALQSTPPGEVEDAAWILTQMGHLELARGNTAMAEKYLENEAVQLLQQRYQAAPQAENLFDLAEALQLAGRSEQARQAFAEFERKSLAETNRKDNSNPELVFYYADYQHARLTLPEESSPGGMMSLQSTVMPGPFI